MESSERNVMNYNLTAGPNSAPVARFLNKQDRDKCFEVMNERYPDSMFGVSDGKSEDEKILMLFIICNEEEIVCQCIHEEDRDDCFNVVKEDHPEYYTLDNTESFEELALPKARSTRLGYSETIG